MRLRTVATIGLVVAMLATGCGGEDAPPNGDGQGVGEQGLRSSEEIAEAALAIFDGDLGVTAVAMLAAADRGYAPLQVVVAIEDSTLTGAGGVIVDGTVTTPEREPEGTITGKPTLDPAQAAAVVGDPGVVIASVGDGAPVTFDGLRATFADDLLAAMDEAVPAESAGADPAAPTSSEDDEASAELRRVFWQLEGIRSIALLHAEGYSVEQIILGIVGGLVRYTDDPYDLAVVAIEGEAPRYRPRLVYEDQQDLSPPPTADDDADVPDPADGDTASSPAPTSQHYTGAVLLNEEIIGSRAFELAGVTEDEVVVDVTDGRVTGLSLRFYYAYRTCGDGHGNLECTIDTGVAAAMTGGPVPLADGTATVPLDATVQVLGCTGSVDDCEDFPAGEQPLQAAADITVTGDMLTGVVTSEGVPAFDFTASR